MSGIIGLSKCFFDEMKTTLDDIFSNLYKTFVSIRCFIIIFCIIFLNKNNTPEYYVDLSEVVPFCVMRGVVMMPNRKKHSFNSTATSV